MKNINWVKKLTSRKFWAAVVGFVTPIMIAAGATDNSVTQVTAIIMGGATLIAYIIGEGMTDAGMSETMLKSKLKRSSKEYARCRTGLFL